MFHPTAGKASVEKTPHGIAPTSSTSSSNKNLEVPLTIDDSPPPIKIPAADGLGVTQNCQSVDKHQTYSPSTSKNDNARAERFRTPREDDKRSRRHSIQHLENTGRYREAGERRTSWESTRPDPQGEDSGGDEENGGLIGLAEVPHRRCSSLGEKGSQQPRSTCTKRRERHEKERTRFRKEGTETPGHRPRKGRVKSAKKTDKTEKGGRVNEKARSPTSYTDDEGDESSEVNFQPPGHRNGLEPSDSRKKDRGSAAEEKDIELSEHDTDLPAPGLDATNVEDVESGTHGDEGTVVHSGANGDGNTKQSRVYPSDNEQVETIELGEGMRHDNTDITQGVKQNRATDEARQQADGPVPASVVRCHNQEENEDGDEEIDIDIEVPQLELGTVVEGHQRGQSATSRLHRHILRPETEAETFNGSIPPPKEFLKQPSLKPAVTEPREVGRCPGKTSSSDIPQSASHGRRRSAADLEWNDGGGTPDVRLLTYPVVKVSENNI